MIIIVSFLSLITGVFLKLFTYYFDKNILAKWSVDRQNKYYEYENHLSFMIYLGMFGILVGVIFN